MITLIRKKTLEQKEQEIRNLMQKLLEAKEKNNRLETNLKEMWSENPPLVKMFKEFRNFYHTKFPSGYQLLPTQIFKDFMREYNKSNKYNKK